MCLNGVFRHLLSENKYHWNLKYSTSRKSWFYEKKITKRSEQEEKIWAIQFIRVSMDKHIICIFKYKFE